jgi:hypothetical protein
MFIWVQLIDQARRHVTTVAVPRLPEPPSVVLWGGRAFHRYGSNSCSSRMFADGDIYRECSVVEGVEVE